MKRFSRRALLAVIPAVFSAFLDDAVAASEPTLKCSRVGQSIIFRDKKYTCVKSGKKLVWDKGVKLTATPKPSPATSSASSPTPVTAPKTTDTLIANSSEVRVGETKIFRVISSSGQNKSYVITRMQTSIIALSTICPHAGFLVNYANKKLLCSGHAALFSAETGAVERGPATSGLEQYPVREENGKIYLTD